MGVLGEEEERRTPAGDPRRGGKGTPCANVQPNKDRESGT